MKINYTFRWDILWMHLILLMLPAQLSAAVPPPNGPGNALRFDGVDDRLTTPSVGWDYLEWLPAGNSQYTIEAWITTTTMNAGTIAAWGTFGAPNQVNGFRLTPSGLVNYWWTNDLYATINLVGGWHHVAATFDGTTRRILVDGVVLSSDTPVGHSAAAENFSLGSANRAEFFSGLMDEVRIWNIGRTAGQIQEAMRRQLWGNETGLVAYWRFDEGTGLGVSESTGKAAPLVLANGPGWVDSTITPFAPFIPYMYVESDPAARFYAAASAKGAPTEVYFEWGADAAFENKVGPFSIPLDNSTWQVSAVETRPTPGLTYQVRCVATNTCGASYSTNITFVMEASRTNLVLNLNDSGYGSLRQVIRDLPSGDTIRFAPQVAGTITVTNGEIVIPRSMRIEGPGAERLTLSGNWSNRLFRVAAGQVRISGLSLNFGKVTGTNGYDAVGNRAAGNGQAAEGGALLNLADLTVSDCVFYRNSANGGLGGAGLTGSPYNEPSNGAQGGNGGGGAVANYGTLAIANSLFDGNQAIGGAGGLGGAGFESWGANGAAGGAGGGSYGGTILNHGALSVSNCAFEDSYAEAGAGGGGGGGRIYGGLGGRGGNVSGSGLWSDHSFTLINCTFESDDIVSGQGGAGGTGGTWGPGASGGAAVGGAIYDRVGGTLVHCTIAGNTCVGGLGGFGDPVGPTGSEVGGGVATASDGRFIVLNTVIAENQLETNPSQAHDVSGTFVSLGHNFIGKKDGSSGWNSSDIVGTTATPKDPKLSSYREQTRSMSPIRGSPLIDAGDDSVLGSPLYMATDQRGGPRCSFGHVDIGAVEIGSALRITRLQTNGAALDVSFTTEYGFPYHLESKDTCSAGPWTPFGPLAIVGDGNEMTVKDTRARAATNRFYRVVLTP